MRPDIRAMTIKSSNKVKSSLPSLHAGFPVRTKSQYLPGKVFIFDGVQDERLTGSFAISKRLFSATVVVSPPVKGKDKILAGNE